MTADQDFFSFANALASALTGSGINIVMEKADGPAMPFLRLSKGPTELLNTWVNSTLCQGWLVVEKLATEPLEVTLARHTDAITRATRDMGIVDKTDYGATPAVSVGGFSASIKEITQDMSSDPLRAKRVITWHLLSTGK